MREGTPLPGPGIRSAGSAGLRTSEVRLKVPRTRSKCISRLEAGVPARWSASPRLQPALSRALMKCAESIKVVYSGLIERVRVNCLH